MNKKVIIISAVVVLGIVLYAGYNKLKPYRSFTTQVECERVQRVPCVEFDYDSWSVPHLAD